MPLTTSSSGEFERDVGKAGRAAENGPVVIGESGEPAGVPMKHEARGRLIDKRRNLADLLNHAESMDIEFVPERMRDGWPSPIEFD